MQVFCSGTLLFFQHFGLSLLLLNAFWYFRNNSPLILGPLGQRSHCQSCWQRLGTVRCHSEGCRAGEEPPAPGAGNSVRCVHNLSWDCCSCSSLLFHYRHLARVRNTTEGQQWSKAASLPQALA